jgi:hypothetical protein
MIQIVVWISYIVQIIYFKLLHLLCKHIQVYFPLFSFPFNLTEIYLPVSVKLVTSVTISFNLSYIFSYLKANILLKIKISGKTVSDTYHITIQKGFLKPFFILELPISQEFSFST